MLAPANCLCSDADLIEIASKIVEQLASKQKQLCPYAADENADSGTATDDLKAQYLLLRIALVGVHTSIGGSALTGTVLAGRTS